MSHPRDRDLARGWKAAERLLEEERLEGLDDEALEREMRAMPDVGPAPTVDELVAHAKHRAADRRVPGAGGQAGGEADRRPESASTGARRGAGGAGERLVWLLAAALAAVVAVATYESLRPTGPNIVADTPDEAWRLRMDRARALRGEAAAACDEGRLEACGAKLDEAKALDPEGEGSASVQAARAKIRSAPPAAPDAAPSVVPSDPRQWGEKPRVP
jgi:hypothetical protein